MELTSLRLQARNRIWLPASLICLGWKGVFALLGNISVKCTYLHRKPLWMGLSLKETLSKIKKATQEMALGYFFSPTLSSNQAELFAWSWASGLRKNEQYSFQESQSELKDFLCWSQGSIIPAWQSPPALPTQASHLYVGMVCGAFSWMRVWCMDRTPSLGTERRSCSSLAHLFLVEKE